MNESQLQAWAAVSAVRKADEERTASGVVLEPGEDGEAEAIRATAHAFLAGQRKLRADGVQAKSIRPVESFVAPTALEIGGRRVPAGSWVLTVRVLDDVLWKKIRKGGGGFAVPTIKLMSPGGNMAALRLKAQQKAKIERQLSQLLRQAVGVMRDVRGAKVDERALPSSELTGVFRNLADGFGRLAGSGAVEKAGRKISTRRADQFKKALRILLALATEFGLEQKGIFKALRGAGFELPDDVATDVPADDWPADMNTAEDRENG